MLEDDLCAIPPNKHHREGIVAFDPAHELDPVHKEHRHINVVVAEMLQEGVLKAEGALYCHCPSLWERFIQDAALHDSAAPAVLSTDAIGPNDPVHRRLSGSVAAGNHSTSTTLIAWGNF
jgi:hypothetical protein